MVCEFDACPDHDGPCIPWAGKPVLTWGIAVEHTSGSATMEPPKRVVPALRQQPGTVVETSLEGPDMQDDSGKVHPAVIWRRAILADGERWPLNTLHSTSRLVACALAEHIDRNGQAYPGVAVLARRSGLSERAVRTHLDLLADAGWLSETERGGQAGGRRTTLWTIVTPAPPAWVTPERGAGVESETPANDATTPEPHAPTPAPPAPELEELGELEREGAPGSDLVAWAQTRIGRHPEEAADVIAALIDRHGEARVRAASRSLLARKFAHASDLRTAIDAAIGIRPERPPLRVVSARPECDNCLGSGMVSPPGSNIATRCPECNPHPAPVAEGAQP
mgnify:FL=1